MTDVKRIRLVSDGCKIHESFVEAYFDTLEKHGKTKEYWNEIEKVYDGNIAVVCNDIKEFFKEEGMNLSKQPSRYHERTKKLEEKIRLKKLEKELEELKETKKSKVDEAYDALLKTYAIRGKMREMDKELERQRKERSALSKTGRFLLRQVQKVI